MPQPAFVIRTASRRKSGRCASLFGTFALGFLVSASYAFAQPPQTDVPAEVPPAEGPAPAPLPPPVLPAPSPAPLPATLTAAAPAPEPESGPFAFAVDLGAASVSETNATTVVLSPLLAASFDLDPDISLDLAWGFIWAIDGQGSTTRAGNPALSGSYRMKQDEFTLRASLGVTAPVASYQHDPDGRLYAFDYNQSMAMWGLWNAWLWTPNRMAVPVTFRLDRPFDAGPALRAELGVAPVFGVRGDASGVDTFIQVAIEAGLPIGSTFVLRPRLQVVVLPSDSVDRSQTALGLRGVLRTRYGDYFGGILVNLDEPYGVFGGLERWGLHLGKEIDL